MSYIALFDLDETLINCKSLFEVYKAYCIQEIPEGEKHYKETLEKLNSMQRVGVSRNEVNREFYRGFSGVSQEKMIINIRKWLELNINNNNFFNKTIVDELRRHQELGAIIIIISGSFADCVSVIAEYLNIENFLSVNLENINGIYTGEIYGIQTIGEGKLEAIVEYINCKELSIKGSYGYGDHMSDIPFLELVDHPNIVAVNDEMIEFARKHSWPILQS